MTNFEATNLSGRLPPRWLHCPRKASKLVQKKFLVFKTPLSKDFDSQVPEECRFTPEMLFASLKSQNLKMGLWIDLTYTKRFYDPKKEVEVHGCQYLKIACRAHGETPSVDQTQLFVKFCQKFISKHPLEIVGVHCTHGFNRTGFLIISYLIEIEGFSVDAALSAFASVRSPGIYKENYIRELYLRFDDVEDAPAPPPRPAWCLEYDDDDVEDEDEDCSGQSECGESSGQRPVKKRKRELTKINPVFMEGVPGVKALTDSSKISGIQRRVQEICGWESTGFPGSQPVSMDKDNIVLLHQKPYRVSWKADGTRYLMLIQGDGDLYFIDRDNSVFQVNGLCFPHVRDVSRTIRDTLLDGEMVIDNADGKKYPRYLAYDVIMYDGRDVKKLSFWPERYEIIEKEIMRGRRIALEARRLRREREPFSVRLKQFWDISQARNLVSEKFAKKLGHEPDGLIFQPAKNAYLPGAAKEVLRWNPASLNSVDFRLKIVIPSGMGILPKKVGQLFVGQLTEPFGYIKITKATKDLDNKIIECKLENDDWVFMRERTDKSFPNSYDTAAAVCQSILNPVAAEYLFDYIQNHRFMDDSDLMPPPSKKKT